MRPKPDYLVSFWGVKCYINDETGYLWGVNKFYDSLIPLAVIFDNFMADITHLLIPSYRHPGFKMAVLKEYNYDKEDKIN